MARPVPPTGFAAIRAAMATSSAGVPRGRRLLGLVVLMGLPVFVAAMAVLFGEAGRGEGFSNFADMVTHAYAELVLPLALISLGTGTFGDEWASGTPHYVVGLPLPRWALVVGRWLATVRRALLFVLPAILLVYVLSLASFGEALAHYLPELLWVLAAISALTMAYSAIFILLGLAVQRAVICSLVYVFVIETLTSKMPQAFATVSLAFHARNVLWQSTGRDAFRPITRDVLAVEPVSLVSSWLWIGVMTTLALAVSTWALRRKECGGDAASKDAAET